VRQGRSFFSFASIRLGKVYYFSQPEIIPQSRNAAFAIWRVVFSVFIRTWFHSCSVLIANLGMMSRNFCRIFLFLIATGCVASNPGGGELAGEFQKVLSVNYVNLAVLESYPEQLIIQAYGTVRTGGWSDPKLVPSSEPVRDGVYHFDFVARRPEGMATQGLSKINVSHNLGPKPANFRGLEIHAEINSKGATLKTP
jgi:hypothetical protein